MPFQREHAWPRAEAGTQDAALRQAARAHRASRDGEAPGRAEANAGTSTTASLGAG